MSAERPRFFSKKIVRESSLSLVALGAVSIFSLAVARCSIDSAPPSKGTWEFWGKVVPDPQDPEKLVLIKCPPLHGRFP